MAEFTLVIGTKNYSSWSLRSWLALKRCAVAFDETLIDLAAADRRGKILGYSKAGLVPVLIHDRLIIWETMAICEYLAERFPDAGLWPGEPAARAVCRAVANEMHAGFASLRTHMPMDIRNSYPGVGLGRGVQADIDRIVDIWHDCRQQYGQSGPYLFGGFTIADAMFAPVVARFKTYGVDLPEQAVSYCNHVWECPDMIEWRAAAAAETSVVA
ncbi:MAG: glutathione S-transferase family protein [Rhodospirillales bacterium]|nr:glutathione S-transferase family protein [Rhodospirillales bacterium]